MKKNKSFSDLLIDLTDVWLSWMHYNTKCKNVELPIKERAQAAEKCEALIDRRYEIQEQLDLFFQNNT